MAEAAHSIETTADWALDRTSPLPLYAQIRQRLLAMILDWPADAPRFHTEKALAARFGVSHLTVRQAFADLVEAGYLHRHRGQGTFVTRRVFEEKLSSAMDIETQYAAAGTDVDVTLLDFAYGAASEADARQLDLPSGAEVLRLRRLRAVAGMPIAIDARTMPRAVAASAGFTRQVAVGNIIEHLKTHAAVRRGDWEIEARLPSADEAKHLKLKRSVPVLVRAMTYFDTRSKPVLTGATIHRSDKARYRLSLDLTSAAATANIL
jgi:GntR family transcriptional regulator